MPVIKRYPNRKLYNTEAKEYITLEGIAELIRGGRDIQVIDNVSGEDITALTLTQIIFEQEKNKSGLLPRPLLAGLIRASGDSLNALQRSIMSPKIFLHQVDDEIKKRINDLVHRGDLLESEGQHLLEKLISVGELPKTKTLPSDEAIEQAIKARNLPSRDEFSDILSQLENLATKLDELSSPEDETPQAE